MAKKRITKAVIKAAATQTRTEVLSVKASAPEKDMILRAAKTYNMPYSEFVRLVAIGACRNMGLEEVQGITSEDVRRPHVRRPKNVDESEPTVVPDTSTTPPAAEKPDLPDVPELHLNQDRLALSIAN